jgi:hypothetical protein
MTSDERARLKALEREVRELRQANEILRKASGVFCGRRSSTAGGSHDRLHRRSSRRLRGRADLQGVLPIAPSTYHATPRGAPIPRRRRRGAPRRRSSPEIRAGLDGELRVYGVRKVWRQLGREGIGGRALHGGAADAPDGSRRRCQRKGVKRRQRQGGALSARPGEPAVQGGRRPTGSGSRTSPTSPPGPASSTSPSSSTPSPGGSSAGGCRAPPRPASSSTPWSRRSTPAGRPGRRPGPPQRPRVQYLSIRYTERLARPASSPRSAASATATTMPSPRR